MRLTGKLPNGIYHFKRLSKDCDILYNVLRKLGQLEDIEDELGIDLTTLFKALKDGVYWILDDGQHIINYTKEVKALRRDKGSWFIHEGWFDIGCPIRLYLKDYGVTWALERTELE